MCRCSMTHTFAALSEEVVPHSVDTCLAQTAFVVEHEYGVIAVHVVYLCEIPSIAYVGRGLHPQIVVKPDGPFPSIVHQILIINFLNFRSFVLFAFSTSRQRAHCQQYEGKKVKNFSYHILSLIIESCLLYRQCGILCVKIIYFCLL